MKILTLLALIIPSIAIAQNPSAFSGSWMRTVPDTVILQVTNYSVDSFEFKLISYNPNSYGYLGGDRYSNDKYARFNDSTAYFNDAVAISDGEPLYYEGEDPCELLFEFMDSSTIEMKEKNCSMIYGGAGISWGGEYVVFKK